MKISIALLPGDGIGPEVIDQAVKVLNAVGEKYKHEFTYKKELVGACAIDATGNPLPEKTLDICKASDAVLFGAIGHPKFDNNPDAKVRPEQGLLKLRKELGLFANIRPVTAYDTLIQHSPIRPEIITNTDFIVYRELTGGIYFGEKKNHGDVAYDLCEYSTKEIDRMAHLAFKAAQVRKQKLTLVDKANVLETSRLWRKQVTEIAKQYPDVKLEFLFVDNAAMQIILNPTQFDIILTENMFGDILSDEASVISGSIGLLASASVGDDNAMFEPIHGSYPQAEGKNIANPLASILSAAMLLDHFKLYDEADLIREAVESSLEKGYTTEDLKNKKSYSTTEVGDYIANYILTNNLGEFNKDNLNLGQSTII